MSSICEKFKEKMNYYNDINTHKNNLKNRYMLLLVKKEKTNPTNIKDRLQIDYDITNIESKLKELEKDKIEDYLMNISDIIKDYDMVDNNDFESKQIGSLSQILKYKSINNRGELYAKYMNNIENKPIKQTPNTNINLFCKTCSVPWTISQNDALYICENCGNYESYFETTNNGMTYEQEINTDINVSFAYKRSNHLREILAQLQAKETSNIPDNILNALRTEFKKSRINNLSEITQEKVKVYLKKLKFNKYYENTRQITNILNGKPPPIVSDELYEKLINMFMEIQEPFEKVCPKNRKNFFSYNYILYKFCELLGETETMQLFPLLKSREKLYHQDCIWKKICELNNWPFYKSV